MQVEAHVRLDTHHTHPSAVTAEVSGWQASVALTALEAANWTVTAPNKLVLARIDHEEPYWAQENAKHLRDGGIAVEITPRLQEAMNEERTWGNYPMPWCTRSEVRELSNQAQKIFDDIDAGHLLIHAHAHDGHTTVAVGTYLHRGGKSVYLHGENHLRQIAGTFDSPAQALTAFEKVHAAEMRPGPAPLTDTEHAALAARSGIDVTTATSEPARPTPETVPVYLADAGDHDTLLDTFLDAHGEFQKWRTWSDETTHVVHESQTLRIEQVHEAQADETAWTVAAYETPVSDRTWVLTTTGATPAPVLQKLLNHLAGDDGWDTAPGSPVHEKVVATATQPLSDAGWKQTLAGQRINWTSPTGDAGIQFDAFTAHHPVQNPATWTVWAGHNPNRPLWTLTSSAHTPSSLLASLSEALAHETGLRHPRTTAASPKAKHVAGPPAPPATPAVGRVR